MCASTYRSVAAGSSFQAEWFEPQWGQARSSLRTQGTSWHHRLQHTGDAVHCVWLWRWRNTLCAAFTLTTVVPRAAAAGVVKIHSQNLSMRTCWNGLNAWLTHCSDKHETTELFLICLVVKLPETILGKPIIPVRTFDTPPHAIVVLTLAMTI